MRSALCWLIALLLWVPWLAGATTAIFYQPQLRDREVAQAQWPSVFAQVRARGFDTLVVQWTQDGDAFGDPAGHAWLLQRVHEAHAAGLRIVLGLYNDPAFFHRLEVEALQKTQLAVPDDYLPGLLRHNAEVARRWGADLGGEAIAGWYLPIEIDDMHWRSPAARKQLEHYLAAERRQLDGIAQRPVYVTSFFRGNMTPSRYAELLSDVQRSGVRVWVQDGAGIASAEGLEGGVRALYLGAVSQCASPHVHGIIYEIFRQTGKDAAFTAAALPAVEASAALAQRTPCGGDSVFFELGYLPEMAGVLRR
ncbi:hypothetical protein GCM10008098_00790 [Rhodanobacter panaciterrae]|uniref:DUF4434 domain-containing protein n=1 Tax=Rhodanobacter panaciterrae TaxID=490572 RepID=A0ABQ2ZHL2_9GAMM|nr:DUF4434 domain-containing protein [Rhodanobacter panaciterrae]GGY13998.1 hypothetical protein GCM10008098_00790 [Rhodanobacter panaciterrae]